MEDINNALLHIKAKHNGEIPYQYGSKECAKLMDSYAKEYHERQLKLLGIADVVGQSELLVCPHCEGKGDYTEHFLEWRNRFFEVDINIQEWKTKNKGRRYTTAELHKSYEKAMLQSPFNCT